MQEKCTDQRQNYAHKFLLYSDITSKVIVIQSHSKFSPSILLVFKCMIGKKFQNVSVRFIITNVCVCVCVIHSRNELSSKQAGR